MSAGQYQDTDQWLSPHHAGRTTRPWTRSFRAKSSPCQCRHRNFSIFDQDDATLRI